MHATHWKVVLVRSYVIIIYQRKYISLPALKRLKDLQKCLTTNGYWVNNIYNGFQLYLPYT